MSENFQSAWVAEFSESKLWNGGQLVVGFVLGVNAWYQWAIRDNTSTTEVFFWMLAATGFIFAVFWFHARRIWDKEHRARITADERHIPRPKVVPYFDAAFQHPQPTNTWDVRFDNHGTEEAVNVSVDEIELRYPKGRIRFPRDPRVIPAGGHINIRPEIVSEERTHNDLAHAIGWDNTSLDRTAWPVELFYGDLSGRRFYTRGAFEIIGNKQVIFRFIESGLC